MPWLTCIQGVACLLHISKSSHTSADQLRLSFVPSYFADGHTQIVLDVNGPKFVSVSRSYEPEDRSEAKAKALAWAQELRDGLAAFLGIAAGVVFIVRSPN